MAARLRLSVTELESRALPSAYFVSTAGSDANPGTAALPWKTLQHAADLVRPGDGVDVAAGDYKGFDLATSGRPDAPIAFTAEPGARITQPEARRGSIGDGRYGDGINVENFGAIGYITIQGFTIVGMRQAGIRVAGDVGAHSTGVTLIGNVTDGNGTWGIFTAFADNLTIAYNVCTNSGTQHGIYVSNSPLNPWIVGNVCAGNAGCGIQINADISQGGTGICSGALIEKNVCYENGRAGGAAINLDGVTNSVIQNNLLTDNHASGIVLYQADGGAGPSGDVVVNNTVLMSADARWAFVLGGGGANNYVLNNVFLNLNPRRGAMTIDPGSLAGLTSDFNALTGRFTLDDGTTILTLAQWQARTGQDADSFAPALADLFEDLDGRDFHLKANSPLIGSGTSFLAPGDDLEGSVRIGNDIGAYSWQG